MKEWIATFAEEFSLPEKDKGDLLAAADTIESEPHALEIWNALTDRYKVDRNTDLQDIRHEASALSPFLGVHRFTLELLIFISLSEVLREYYRKAGIADSIWFNSMCDLKYKLAECREVYGIAGSFVADWFPGFFYLTRFALGRLQFEISHPAKTMGEFMVDGVTFSPDSEVLNIHIPRTGTPLSPDSVENAFARAAVFFGDRFGDVIPFHCSSWMLDPTLREILHEKSNTRRFCERFSLYASGKDTELGSTIWRIFDRLYSGNIGNLPINTPLRRDMVRYLSNGGMTGWGKGILVYRRNTN